MNLFFARSALLIGIIALVAIPATLHRGRAERVVASRKRVLERTLLGCMSVGLLLALVWLATPLLELADYPLWPAPYAIGVLIMIAGLWLHYQAHKDLGAAWSITLEVREQHRLVTEGVYRRLRHPMYLALLLYAVGQALVVPNWLAGPCYLVTVATLVAFRIGPEERMMRELFGDAWTEYRARTRRLIPGIW